MHGIPSRARRLVGKGLPPVSPSTNNNKSSEELNTSSFHP